MQVWSKYIKEANARKRSYADADANAADGNRTKNNISPTFQVWGTEKLNKFIQELSNRNLVIMGDYNYSNIDWNNLHTTRDGLDFMNFIMEKEKNQDKYSLQENLSDKSERKTPALELKINKKPSDI